MAGTKTRKLRTYEYNRLGLPYKIIIKNTAIEEYDPKTNERISTAIPDFKGFVAAFIMIRILVANKLRGEEVRTFRKAFGLMSKDFAGLMKVSPETVSRWENNTKPISEEHERIMRLHFGMRFKDEAPMVPFLPGNILEMGLKARFPDGYQPNFVFSKTSKVENIAKEWDGHLLKAA